MGKFLACEAIIFAVGLYVFLTPPSPRTRKQARNELVFGLIVSQIAVFGMLASTT